MEQSPQAEQELVHFCHWHAQAETRISCSRCGKYVCPQCMVQAPVGIRCRECGQVTPMPTYDVRPPHYLRAIGVAAVVAVAGGFLWWIANQTLFFVLQGQVSSLLLSVAAVGIGYGTGELVSLAVNRKRSIILAWIAGVAVVISYLISLSLTDFFGVNLYGLLFVVVGVFFAIQRVRR